MNTTESIVAQLDTLQRFRKHDIGMKNKLSNGTAARVRSIIGFEAGQMDEKARAVVVKRADKIITRILDAEPQDDQDEPIARAAAPYVAMWAKASEPFDDNRVEVEKEMRKLGRQLPVWASFGKGVGGFGELGLAVIVAEVGDLSKYPHYYMLWKRLGLAPYNGKAASTWRREGGLSAEEWTALGYSPRRRAEIYAVIGDPLFRRQSAIGGPYRAVYDARRARTAETHPDWSKAHSHNDALRIMTKRLIRDLWVAWREATATVTTSDRVPPADISETQTAKKPVTTSEDLPSAAREAIEPAIPTRQLPPADLSNDARHGPLDDHLIHASNRGRGQASRDDHTDAAAPSPIHQRAGIIAAHFEEAMPPALIEKLKRVVAEIDAPPINPEAAE